MKTPEKQLRNTIKGNAAFSFISGITLILFRKDIATFMNITNTTVLLVIGFGLLLFVASLLQNAYKKVISPKKVKFIIIQDWAWVIGSIILLISHPFNISIAGNILIGVVAMVVMFFAIGQQRALAKLL